MKEEQILKYLANFGLRPLEAAVYLTILKLGQSTVGKISQESSIQRTFVYDLLHELQEKGLVSCAEVRGVKNFSAISFASFKRLQENKVKRFESILPELLLFEKSVGDRPKITMYEGRDGLAAAQYDTLQFPNSEISAYAAAEGLYYDEPGFAKNYIKERVKNNIRVRAICPDSELLRPYVERNKAELRISRTVPAGQFPFTNEIDIYGNKVAILSYTGELLAVIIESESVARTQRMIFELAWLGAGKFNKS
ncbi:MAG: helix-turn-helix domain-containing protein [Patescibacteria group bacterium]